MFGRRRDRWSPDLLKEHYDGVFKDRDDATERTRRQMELRLDSMNEFRQSLSDLTSKFVTRGEMRATVAVASAVVAAAVAVIQLLR